MIGGFSRFGTSKQITLGVLILIFIKLSESYANDLMLKSQGNWLALYLPIIIGLSIFGLLIFAASNQKFLTAKKQLRETT